MSFRGVSRTRVLAVLCAALGMAVSTFVGATTAASLPWLLVPIVFAWAYVTGVLAALGPTVLAVTLQWPVALLIASALPLDPRAAAARAGLVLAGGLWQCLLVVTSWALDRGSAERTALATTYTQIAEYASGVAAGRQGPPSPNQLTASYVLGDPNPLVRTAARRDMLDLAEEAERIRATLAALAAVTADDDHGNGRRRLLDVAADVLRQLAMAIGRRPRERADHLATARRALNGRSAEPGASWHWAGEALLGQLRGACLICEQLNAAEPSPARRGVPPPIGLLRGRDTRLTIRASLGTSSEAGRHALRLAVVSAVAEVIARASGVSHGYWIVLTIFIVLRPDYSSTIYRGLQRAAGTVIGAGLGVATALLMNVSLTALLCGIALSLLAAYSVFAVNYLLYAVFLTDFIVVLLALLGLPPDPTAFARLIGTAIGTGLAILAYLLWPTWEGTSAAEKFARLITAQGSYARALLRAYTRPDGRESARLRSLQLAARRARIDAEASADRLAGEPAHAPMSAATARALAAAGHRVAQALLTLDAAVTAHQVSSDTAQDRALQPRLDELAAGVARATDQIATALRAAGVQAGQVAPSSSQAVDAAEPVLIGRLPPLREQQQAIWDSADESSSAVHPAPADHRSRAAAGDAVESAPPGAEAAGLFAATDSLVDAVNTAAHVLAEASR